MKRHASGKSSWGGSRRGAVATGAASTGATAIGALALGAVSLGALAIGALAIGRLGVGRARVRRLEIGELVVARLDLGADVTAARPMALTRLRAAPGQGDAFARLVAGRMGEGDPGPLVSRVFRAGGDPDLFLVRTARVDGGALGPEPWAPWLDAVLRDAVARDLVPAPIARPPEADLFLPIERRGAPPPAPAREP